jgi:hypothetical protein
VIHIVNVHRRRIAAPVDVVGVLIDTLASPDDRLWPGDRWPPMRLDRPLGIGADGGHAFIRYRAEAYQPGRTVRFRFGGPNGLSGTHSFEVEGDHSAATLTHTIDGAVTLRFAPVWLAVVRPLHEALIEDCLDRAEAEAAGAAPGPTRWSWWVRLLRRLARGRR